MKGFIGLVLLSMGADALRGEWLKVPSCFTGEASKPGEQSFVVVEEERVPSTKQSSFDSCELRSSESENGEWHIVEDGEWEIEDQKVSATAGEEHEDLAEEVVVAPRPIAPAPAKENVDPSPPSHDSKECEVVEAPVICAFDGCDNECTGEWNCKACNKQGIKVWFCCKKHHKNGMKKQHNRVCPSC